MMKITVLASGSGGNATYLESNNTKLLIDCGISYRQITKRLQDRELTVDGLDAILITHEHTDHIKGLDVTLRRNPDVTTYLTEKTHQGMFYKAKENIDTNQLSFVTPYLPFMIDDIEVTPLSISHDSSDAVGYVLRLEGKKVVYITDIGYLPVSDHDALRDADVYIFESNYDVTMLYTSSRPFYLKQRIDSVKGHMSNTDSAYNLTQLVGEHTKKIILAHRSKECNTDQCVLDTYHNVFGDYDLDASTFDIEVAHQDIPTKLFIF